MCIATAAGEPLMYASPKRSALVSGLLHAAVIVLVLTLTKVVTPPPAQYHSVPIAGRDISAYVPVFRSDAGGGGGTRDPTPASRGELPKRALRQFTPPTVRILNENPRLPMEASILGPPDVAMPTPAVIGLPDGIIGAPSNGLGMNGGIGDRGKGGGVGNKEGPGAGPGDNGVGVTVMSAGRGFITQAVLQWKAEPEYSEEARKAKLQGTVILRIEIDARGQAQNIVVARSLGLGLDDKAVEAVRRWRFRPATQAGKPIVSAAVVEVNFRLL
jgi:protein TonB